MEKTYIAVIGRRENLGRGCQHAATFTDTDKEQLVRKALRYRETDMGNNSDRYEIFVGELTHEVIIPIDYTLSPLNQ